MRILFVAAAILSTVCTDALGQAYRWVDRDGRVHYTQTPPPPDARNVQRKSFRGGGVDVSSLPYATQVAAKNFPVTLYTLPDCQIDRGNCLPTNASMKFASWNVNWLRAEPESNRSI